MVPILPEYCPSLNPPKDASFDTTTVLFIPGPVKNEMNTDDNGAKTPVACSRSWSYFKNGPKVDIPTLKLAPSGNDLEDILLLVAD